MVVLILFVFLGVFGGMGFLVYKTLKQTESSMTGSAMSDKRVDTAQEFLPFDNIDYIDGDPTGEEGIIDLGGQDYRGILECNSTNYYLKTAKEQDIIEMSFQRFLNSLSFPITFFIQTKVIDDSKMLLEMKDELEDIIKIFPQLEEYANEYFGEIQNLHQYIDNNKTKRKYVIIPFDSEETADLTEHSSEEKKAFAMKELKNRIHVIKEGLSNLGVNAQPMSRDNIIELVYSIYHRDDYTNVENLVSGEYLEGIVDGDSKIAEINNKEHLDWILYEAEKRIQKELLAKSLSEDESDKLSAIIEMLDELRQKAEHLDDDEEDEGITL